VEKLQIKQQTCIPGVSVYKGTTGMTSDFEGNYSIDVKEFSCSNDLFILRL
jgi:hypothetical protein